MKARVVRARGVTLIELLVVMMILSLILTAAVKAWDVTLERGRFESTRRKLDQLATAVTGDPNYIVAGQRADFGYVGDMGMLPQTLADLVVRPDYADTALWRGPYVRATFSESPEGYRIDGWGDTITFNSDSMFLRSFGGKGLADRTAWMTRSLGYTKGQLAENRVSGQIIDVRGTPPPTLPSTDSLKLWVTKSYNGQRLLWPVTPSVSGYFEDYPVFQGQCRLLVHYVHGTETDSSVKNLVVYPGTGALGVLMRLPVEWDTSP